MAETVVTGEQRRLGVWPAVGLAGVVLVLLGRVLLRGDLILGADGTDISLQFLAWRDFGFEQLRQGNLALWNPHSYSGHPFFGGFQPGLLYPPNWLHLFLPLGVAINWVIALHLFLAGYFTALWVFERGVSRWGAGLAGMLFMLSGPVYLHVVPGHLPHLAAMPWAPLLFLCLDKSVGKWDWRWALLGMGVVAMQVYAGHPQYVYFTAMAAGLYTLLNAAGERSWRPVAMAGAMYAGGAVLSAVQIGAGLAATSESWRAGGMGYAFTTQFTLPPENLLTLFAPGVWGDHFHFDYFGRGFLWETTLFFGVAGCGLALAGVMGTERRRRRFALTMALAMVVLALGHYVYVHQLLYRLLPGYSGMRATGKFAYLAVLFLALLAGMGFDGLRQAGRETKRLAQVLGFVAGLLVIGAVVLAVSARQGTTGIWGRYLGWIAAGDESYYNLADYRAPKAIRAMGIHAAWQLAWAAGGFGLVGGLVWAARRYPRAAWGLVGLAGVEMLWVALGSQMTFSLEDLLPPPAWREVAERGATGEEGRVLIVDAPARGIGMMLGLEEIWGFDPAVSKRYVQFMSHSQHEVNYRVRDSQFVQIRETPRIFSMLRLRYVLSMDPGRPVRAVEGALPQVLLVNEARVLAEREAILAALEESGFDPRRTVIVENAVNPAPAADATGTARVVRQSSDELEIEAEVSGPAVLLVTDSYSADWRVRGVGKSPQERYEIVPGNYVLRAIPLAAGKHHLVMEYSPRLYRVGKWVTVLGLLLWGAAWVWLGKEKPWLKRDGTDQSKHGVTETRRRS